MSHHRQTKWAVRIENWHPTHLNQLMNSHWTKRAKLKKSDRDIITFSCLAAGVTKATRPRRVKLEIVLAPGQRAADPDAYWKSLLDALAQCGVLVDDSRTWCEPAEIQFTRGKRPATVIVLEDLRMPDRQHSTNESRLRKKVFRYAKPLRKFLGKLFSSNDR